jgi:AraC-like DNA-binding protein
MSHFLTKKGYLAHPISVSMGQGELHAADLTEVEHHHDFHELVLIGKGSGKHWIDGQPFEVKEGDVFLIKPTQSHFFRDRVHMQHLNVAFDMEQIEQLQHPLLNSLQQSPGFQALFLLDPNLRTSSNNISQLRLSPPSMSAARELFDNMLHEQEHRCRTTNFALFLLFQQLLLLLSRAYEKLETPRGVSLLGLAEVISTIERHYSHHLSLDDLCTQARMSRSTFMRKFKKATGSSPVDFLNRTRVHAAQVMLKDPSLSIAEISHRVGYDDSNYFSRIFKRLTGRSAREVRATHLH